MVTLWWDDIRMRRGKRVHMVEVGHDALRVPVENIELIFMTSNTTAHRYSTYLAMQ